MKDEPITRARILIVDDEASRAGLEKLLKQDGYHVEAADSAERALELAAEYAPDVVVTDIAMSGMDGLAFIERLREIDPEQSVIVMTDDVVSAVKALRTGAQNFLTKPVDHDALSVSVERALESRALQAEAESLRRQIRSREGSGLEGLIGASPAMQEVYRMVRQVAAARATVLITGESGTGKGELARAIHRLGPRTDQPLVALHCASLNETVLESELFGHEPGSSTSADRRRVGRLEQAAGGTLFLDEVGGIPHATQVKLLRLLQDKTFERVGGNETVRVDVRIIAATNRDLAADVREGRFREDLFYRLNVVHIDLPPLRMRNTDVLLLANHFLHRFAKENNKQVRGFSDEARDKILRHAWPGNVGELENAIERAVVMCSRSEILPQDLPVDIAPTRDTGVRIPGASMAEIERHAILSTLEACEGSTTKAAEILGISVRTIQYRLHDYGLAKGARKEAETGRASADA